MLVHLNMLNKTKIFAQHVLSHKSLQMFMDMVKMDTTRVLQ